MSALLVLAGEVFHLCSEQSPSPKLKVRVTKYSLGVSMVCDLRSLERDYLSLNLGFASSSSSFLD